MTFFVLRFNQKTVRMNWDKWAVVVLKLVQNFKNCYYLKFILMQPLFIQFFVLNITKNIWKNWGVFSNSSKVNKLFLVFVKNLLFAKIIFIENSQAKFVYLLDCQLNFWLFKLVQTCSKAEFQKCLRNLFEMIC